MKLLTAAVILFVSFLLISGEKARFDNYRVYSLKIKNEKQLEALKDLENIQNGMFYLEAPISIHKSAEIIVPPHKFADVTEFFNKFEIENVIRVENLQKYVDLRQKYCLVKLNCEQKSVRFQIDRRRAAKVSFTRHIWMGQILRFT